MLDKAAYREGSDRYRLLLRSSRHEIVQRPLYSRSLAVTTASFHAVIGRDDFRSSSLVDRREKLTLERLTPSLLPVLRWTRR